jgi:hypothetical protein
MSPIIPALRRLRQRSMSSDQPGLHSEILSQKTKKGRKEGRKRKKGKKKERRKEKKLVAVGLVLENLISNSGICMRRVLLKHYK